MARLLVSALTAAAGLLGLVPLAGAGAQPCRDPDPQPRRSPIRENRTPFNLSVEQVRSSKGHIVVTLYGSDPKRWLKPDGSLYIYTVPARAPTTRTCIVLPGAGRYAIAVYHDRNGNGRIDRNFLGLPTEDGGLSNNPPVTRMVWPKLLPSLTDVPRAGMATTVRLRRPGL